MFTNLYLKQRWKRSEDIFSHISPNLSSSHYMLSYGAQNIAPKEIKGLSLWPPKEIFNDSKMQELKKSVEEKGWIDTIDFVDLDLLPKQIYTVSFGGNHRALLSDYLDIPSIKADITIIIPNFMINRDRIAELENLKEQKLYLRSEYQNSMKKVHSSFGVIKDVDRYYAMLDIIAEKYDSKRVPIENRIDLYLHQIAEANNLIPSSFIKRHQ